MSEYGPLTQGDLEDIADENLRQAAAEFDALTGGQDRLIALARRVQRRQEYGKATVSVVLGVLLAIEEVRLMAEKHPNAQPVDSRNLQTWPERFKEELMGATEPHNAYGADVTHLPAQKGVRCSCGVFVPAGEQHPPFTQRDSSPPRDDTREPANSVVSGRTPPSVQQPPVDPQL